MTKETKAKHLVQDYYNKRYSESISVDDVHLVWFCKTIQNWKALLITATHDSYFYEVTYNGDKRESYIDVYKKEEIS